MNVIYTWITSSASSAAWNHLVLAMVHTLWQGMIIAALLWGILRGLPARRAEIRYLASAAALAAMVLTGMVTWSLLDRGAIGSHWIGPESAATAVHPMIFADAPTLRSFAPPRDGNAPSAGAPAFTTDLAPASPMPIRTGASIPWTAIAGWLWALGAAALLLRTCAGAARATRWMMDGELVRDNAVERLVAELAAKMRIGRHIRIVAHAESIVPAVAGFVWPTLLLPVSLINEIPAAQLRMILAHELAHIRSFDYLVNFWQRIIESILFFNPAIWWISRQMRIEREACCDACAVQITGAPLVAVQTLAAFAQRLVMNPRVYQPALAMDGGRRGRLLDRIQRIVRPNHRPALGAPWYATAVAVAGGLVLLVVLRAGADVAVSTTQAILTPAQRLEKIAEIQQSQDLPAESNETAPPRIEAQGDVTTADGAPLPDRLKLHIQSRSKHSTSGYTFGIDAKGHFTGTVDVGEISYVAEASGYAPSFAGPVTVGKDGRLPDVKIVLDRGFTARVRVLDQNAKPIPGVVVATAFVQHFIIGEQKLTTDSDGKISIDHATAAAPLKLETSTSGFEFERQMVTLAPNTIGELKLTPSKPTTGTVVDLGTELPLAGATIAMVERKGFENETHSPASDWDAPPVVARTANDGTFSLQTLRADCEYTMWVTAPGHGGELFSNVRAAQVGLAWKLGPVRIIHGKIIGDLSQLERRQDKSGQLQPIETYDSFVAIGIQNFQGGGHVDVTINGNDGAFELRDPPPGHVRFHGPPAQDLNVNVDHIPPLLVIDLGYGKTTQPSANPMRQVVFKFDVPSDSPPPRGKLRVFHFDPKLRANMPDLVPIEQGAARYKIDIPGKVGYEADQLIGYWAPQQMDIDVPAGSDPLEIRIPAIPAGAVSGLVLGPDGKPFDGGYFFVSVDTISKSPAIGQQPQNLQPFNGNGTAGKFFASPLPLGGKYQLTAMADMRIAVSEVLPIDAQTPIRDLTLKFAEGRPVRITVVDADGNPRSGAAVTMSFQMPQHGFGSAPRTTDRNGVVVYEHVNPQVPGDYTLDIAPGIDYGGLHQDVQIDGKPVKVTLPRGYRLQGQVFNSLDSSPISKHKITARPDMAGGTVSRMPVETRTDDFGYFTFENLDQHEYQLEVEDFAPRDITIEKKPDGSVQFHYPAGWKAQVVKGGQTDPVVVQVQPFR